MSLIETCFCSRLYSITNKKIVNTYQKVLHQSNFRQKNQLTGKSLSEALILASTMIVHWITRIQYKKITSSVHKLFFCFCFHFQNNLCTQHVLSWQFSFTELVIQWKIFCHIVSWCNNKCFWQRFTCTNVNKIHEDKVLYINPNFWPLMILLLNEVKKTRRKY